MPNINIAFVGFISFVTCIIGAIFAGLVFGAEHVAAALFFCAVVLEEIARACIRASRHGGANR